MADLSVVTTDRSARSRTFTPGVLKKASCPCSPMNFDLSEMLIALRFCFGLAGSPFFVGPRRFPRIPEPMGFVVGE